VWIRYLWQDIAMRVPLILLGLAYACLTGCAAAPFAGSLFGAATTTSVLQTTAVNGASYLTTGKGVSEHVISGVADQDCKLYNVIDGKKICQEYQLDKIPQRDLTTRFSSEPPQTVEDVILLNTNHR